MLTGCASICYPLQVHFLRQKPVQSPIVLIGLGTKKSVNNKANHQKKYNQAQVTGKLLSSDLQLCKRKGRGGYLALLTYTA